MTAPSTPPVTTHRVQRELALCLSCGTRHGEAEPCVEKTGDDWRPTAEQDPGPAGGGAE
jgi:hypothetical protein